MRVIVCLIALLCGCAAPQVRCDAHLLPINLPAASGVVSPVADGAAPATANGAAPAAASQPARRAP
jgi:hypothetical protein